MRTRNSPIRVSRKHLKIEVSGEKVTITDLGSSAGTFVNDRPATSQLLAVGDTVKLGDTLLSLRVDPNHASTIVGTKPMASEANLADLVGQTIHTYEIRSRIAEGQSGVVFKAWDTSADRDVALKVLWPSQHSGDEETQRFVRAMKTMFPLRHPNVIRIYNAGRNQGMTWFAMEYFKGESLTKIIERFGSAGMLDWRTGFIVAIQIARSRWTPRTRRRSFIATLRRRTSCTTQTRNCPSCPI